MSGLILNRIAKITMVPSSQSRQFLNPISSISPNSIGGFHNKIEKLRSDGRIKILAEHPWVEEYLSSTVDKLDECFSSQAAETIMKGFMEPFKSSKLREIFTELFGVRDNRLVFSCNLDELLGAIEVEKYAMNDRCPYGQDEGTRRAALYAVVRRYPENYRKGLEEIRKEMYRAPMEDWLKEVLNSAKPDQSKSMLETKIRKELDEKWLISLGNLNIKSFTCLGRTVFPELTYLSLHDNKITSFEDMPKMPELETLVLSGNLITSFKGLSSTKFPKLRELDLGDNEITSLIDAKYLPSSLKKIDLSGNNITSTQGMPEHFLKSAFVELDLTGCPLDAKSINTITKESATTNIHEGFWATIKFDNIQSLEDLRDFGIMVKELAAKTTEASDISGLRNLLRHLRECPVFYGSRRAGNMRALGSILKLMIEHQAFREYCFRACKGSNKNRQDFQATFDRMRKELANPAYRGHATLKDVVDYQRQCLNDYLLMAYIKTQMGGGFSQQALLQYELSNDNPDLLAISYSKPDFALPMKNLEIHKRTAQNVIKDNATDIRLIRQIATAPSSLDFLKKLHPEKHELFAKEWDEKLHDVEALSQEGGGISKKRLLRK